MVAVDILHLVGLGVTCLYVVECSFAYCPKKGFFSSLLASQAAYFSRSSSVGRLADENAPTLYQYSVSESQHDLMVLYIPFHTGAHMPGVEPMHLNCFAQCL